MIFCASFNPSVFSQFSITEIRSLWTSVPNSIIIWSLLKLFSSDTLQKEENHFASGSSSHIFFSKCSVISTSLILYWPCNKLHRRSGWLVDIQALKWSPLCFIYHFNNTSKQHPSGLALLLSSSSCRLQSWLSMLEH